jgi:hypothetical protein
VGGERYFYAIYMQTRHTRINLRVMNRAVKQRCLSHRVVITAALAAGGALSRNLVANSIAIPASILPSSSSNKVEAAA